MPAELTEAPTPRDGAYAEAAGGGGIPPPASGIRDPSNPRGRAPGGERGPRRKELGTPGPPRRAAVAELNRTERPPGAQCAAGFPFPPGPAAHPSPSEPRQPAAPAGQPLSRDSTAREASEPLNRDSGGDGGAVI